MNFLRLAPAPALVLLGLFAPLRAQVAEPVLFPAPGTHAACPDTPLRLTFKEPVAWGSGGTLRVFDAADARQVDAVELSDRVDTRSIGGASGYNYHPVMLLGHDAVVTLHPGALAYGHSYYVTFAAGAFRVGSSPSAGIDKTDAWRFTTKPSAPAAGSTRLVVADDGSGDFSTVQGALDFIPPNNTTPTTVFIRKGDYPEIIFVANKHAITLLGEDRLQTVIEYPNNARFNGSGGNPFGVKNPDPSTAPVVGGHIYRRGVLLAHHCDNFVIANLTIRNTTPHGGSQAEAIILNGSVTARAVLKDVDLFSYQDTLQINGQAYITDCAITGDVDFLWGTGPCYFKDCVFRTVRSNAFFTQVRNSSRNHGYVFYHCAFVGAPGVTGNYLSRIEPDRFPDSEVVLISCTLGDAVSPYGWLLHNSNHLPVDGTPHVRFWEYDSRTTSGEPVDASKRHPNSKRLTQADDGLVIKDYTNPTFVLGDDWVPTSEPIFTGRPAR